MTSLRIEKVNELLRHEISQLLLKEVDFSNVLVTITNVDTSPDLRQAKIKICVMPTDKSEEVMKVIQRNIFDLQQELNKKLHMKPVPKMIFEIDKVEVKAQELEEVLRRVEK